MPKGKKVKKVYVYLVIIPISSSPRCSLAPSLPPHHAVRKLAGCTQQVHHQVLAGLLTKRTAAGAPTPPLKIHSAQGQQHTTRRSVRSACWHIFRVIRADFKRPPKLRCNNFYMTATTPCKPARNCHTSLDGIFIVTEHRLHRWFSWLLRKPCGSLGSRFGTHHISFSLA